MRNLFGTDGIRGKANVYPMTVEVAMKIGQAAGMVFKNGNRKSKIVIGKDTRLSGYLIEYALAAGLLSTGAEVYFVGPMPTPAIAHITKSFAADAGIVISASHNPYEDNGIKFF
ncbi:phosphoglucosamine mutase, partial [Candidatus Woesearchaeota archaeon]|nr:phosphoglucosamine mutase [Candidatus Woesearchaeota archaeon]